MPSPAYYAMTAADRALSRAEHERAPAEVLIPLVDALSEAVGEYRREAETRADAAAEIERES